MTGRKKYELTDLTIEHDGRTLYRIRALVDIPSSWVFEGDLGGYVESEKNLAHEGNCWVDGDAHVYGGGHVDDDARVYGHAVVCGGARVFERAKVCGSAVVSGDAKVHGSSMVLGDAWVHGQVEVYDAAVCGGGLE